MGLLLAIGAVAFALAVYVVVLAVKLRRLRAAQTVLPAQPGDCIGQGTLRRAMEQAASAACMEWLNARARRCPSCDRSSLTRTTDVQPDDLGSAAVITVSCGRCAWQLTVPAWRRPAEMSLVHGATRDVRTTALIGRGLDVVIKRQGEQCGVVRMTPAGPEVLMAPRVDGRGRACLEVATVAFMGACAIHPEAIDEHEALILYWDVVDGYVQRLGGSVTALGTSGALSAAADASC